MTEIRKEKELRLKQLEIEVRERELSKRKLTYYSEYIFPTIGA